jgi:Icc-related predicted phosphoesterase
MRILAAADIHGALSVYEWLVESVKHYRADLVLLAGDLFAGDFAEGQREQATQIIPLLKALAVPCFYLMGNDDNTGLEYEDEQVKALHGRQLAWENYNFVGYQFTLRFVGSVFVKPEREIEKDLQLVEPLLNSKSVFVTHTPAYGTLDSTFAGEHVGSPSLAALLERRPVLAHIHGHIHHSFGHEGNRFNVAAGAQRRAMIIDLPALDWQVILGD